MLKVFQFYFFLFREKEKWKMEWTTERERRGFKEGVRAYDCDWTIYIVHIYKGKEGRKSEYCDRCSVPYIPYIHNKVC